MMSMPGTSEWVIILFLALLLFGGKRLPELGSALGRSIRQFKDGFSGRTSEQNDSRKE